MSLEATWRHYRNQGNLDTPLSIVNAGQRVVQGYNENAETVGSSDRINFVRLISNASPGPRARGVVEERALLRVAFEE